jgi:DNA-binding transcriptional MerR regulator
MATAKRKQALARTEVVIPEKIYFRIGEVSELAKLPSYVLRFWETEFPQLRPTKSSTGQRMYRRKEVEIVMQIRKLLYEDGFTIAGARDRLRELARMAHVLPRPTNSGFAGDPLSMLQQSNNGFAADPGAQMVASLPGPQAVDSAVASFDGDQATLFPIVRDPGAAQRNKKLQSMRRQLSDLLELLS